MGQGAQVRTITPRARPLPFALKDLRLRRRRPARAYEEWSTLKRWNRLPADEEAIVGYKLREMRATAGLSQSKLSLRLGCRQQAISQAERWNSNPTVRFLKGWAEATGQPLVLHFQATGS